MTNSIRVLYLFLSILLISFRLTAQNTQMINSLMQDAKQAFAPDRRTVVFDVQARLDSNTLVLTGEVHNSELRERLVTFFRSRTEFTVLDSLVALPHASLGDKTYGVVNVSVANLRAKPDDAAELVSQALLGTPLSVLKNDGEWYLVQTPDGYLGWIDDVFVPMNRDELVAWDARPKIIVTTEFGFTRASRDVKSEVVSDVVVGSLLGLRKGAGSLYQVEYPDGRLAFLPTKSAQPFDRWLGKAKDTPKSIVSTAKRFLGVPYLWGGTSAKAFDCSGFTKTIFYLNGVQLPRDASQQYLVGTPVDVGAQLENLKIGDLLFFGSKASGERKQRVTHVAIYLGNKRFIHASGHVRINSLQPVHADYSAKRRNSFLGARRIIGAGEDTGVRKLSTLPYYGKRGL